MSLIGSNTSLKGTLGWKGERGFSAYEVAVQNGYIGTEEDWLATLGTSSHFTQDSIIYTSTENQTEFDLPQEYTSNSFIDIYVNGLRLTSDEYTIDTEEQTITLTNALWAGSEVEIIVLTMATNNLPIVSTIDSSSTNETAAGSKAVYDFVDSLIHVLSGNVSNIDPGEVKTVDINYPTGFTKSNTNILSKMVLADNKYYDTDDSSHDFPIIKEITLTDDYIKVSLENNTDTQATGYYKITLMKVD